ncbi:AfsR/SARP family transcriptional regulator [Actinomycetota bacterium Odt1-20B]
MPLGSPQQQALLGVLLLHGGRAVGAARLIDALWGEAPPARARGTLRTYASRLRGALEPGRTARSAGTVLVSVGDGYALKAAPGAVDALAFERCVREGEALGLAGDEAGAHALLGEGLGLWGGGGALAGVPGPYAERQRERLGELRLHTQELLHQYGMALGRHAESVRELTVLSAAHPLRERLRALLMLGLYRCGRQGEALAVYADARRTLVAELGVDPSPELAGLHARILAGDPSLAVAHAPDAGRAPLTPFATLAPGLVSRTPGVRIRPRQLPSDIADFTGRDGSGGHLREQLLRASASASASDGDGHGGDREDGGGADGLVCVVLTGAGGIGKSALAVHTAHSLRDHFPDGQLFVDLRGFSYAASDGGIPGEPADPGAVLGAFLEALGVTKDFVPEGVEQRAALYRTLLAGRRVLVVLDNARDAEQVLPLLPGGAGCAALVTTRNRALVLFGAVPVDLDVLTEDEALGLLAATAGRGRVEREGEAARALVAACGRLPLAVRVVGARLAGRPAWTLAAMRDRLTGGRPLLAELRAGDLDVTAAFRVGYEALTEEQARAFRLLALPALTEFDSDVAAALLGTEVVRAEGVAEALVDLGLLETPGAGRYRFHDLLLAYARARCAERESRAERRCAMRRLLDHVLASALAAKRLQEPMGAAAGDPYILRPVHYRRARDFRSLEEARAWIAGRGELLAAVAAAGVRKLPGALRTAVDLLFVWVNLVEDVAQRRSYAGLFEEAARCAAAAGDAAAEARARWLRAYVHVDDGEHALAKEQRALGLRRAEEADDTYLRVFLAEHLAADYEREGDTGRALAHYEVCRALLRSVGDTGHLPWLLARMAPSLVLAGHAERALAVAGRAVEAAQAGQDPTCVAFTAYQLGTALLLAGRPDAASGRFREAIGHHRALGQHKLEGRCLVRLAQCAVAEGRPEEALALLDEARPPRELVADVTFEPVAASVAARARLAVDGPCASALAQLRQIAPRLSGTDVYEPGAARTALHTPCVPPPPPPGTFPLVAPLPGPFTDPLTHLRAHPPKRQPPPLH